MLSLFLLDTKVVTRDVKGPPKVANSKEKDVTHKAFAGDELRRNINDLGFNAVVLWRDSLVPLTVLEASAGSSAPQEVGTISSMLANPPHLPSIQPSTNVATISVVRTSARSLDGGMNVAAQVLRAVEARLGIHLRIHKDYILEFSFHEATISQVSLDELSVALDRQAVQPAVARRLSAENLQRFVIIRALMSPEVVLALKDRNGTTANLDLTGQGQEPGSKSAGVEVSANLDAEVLTDGSIRAASRTKHPLVIGVDYYGLRMSEDILSLGPRQRTGPRNVLHNMVLSSRSDSSCVSLGNRVDPSGII